MNSVTTEENDEKANWSLYMGNNHNRITCDVQWGGCVSFRRHLDKPLSDDLWKDLVSRLQIKALRVYKYNDGQWCDGGSRDLARITLDENENVHDIRIG